MVWEGLLPQGREGMTESTAEAGLLKLHTFAE